MSRERKPMIHPMPRGHAMGVAIFCGRLRGAMATLGGTPVFRGGFSVAMLAGKVLRFSSCQHAHASVGMAPNPTKVRGKEFAAATEDGHTPVLSDHVASRNDQTVLSLGLGSR